LSEDTSSGSLITFIQFLSIALVGYISQFDHTKPPFFIGSNHVPIYRWFTLVLFFFTVNILNNQAFNYRISIPLHIILRSGGPVTTMFAGSLFGKKYSRIQILSVYLITVGIIITAWPRKQTEEPSSTELSSYGRGLVMLFCAQLLSAFMGLYSEMTYKKYGPHWRESLFYTHALSLPLFLPFLPSLIKGMRTVMGSTPMPLQFQFFQPCNQIYEGDRLKWYCLSLHLPRSAIYMALNVIAQYVCITGVNMVVAASSALTLAVVLNIRKVISLLLSIWIFENTLHLNTLIGAIIVFNAGVIYSLTLILNPNKARIN